MNLALHHLLAPRIAALAIALATLSSAVRGAEPNSAANPAVEKPAAGIVSKEIMEKLKLPGLFINLEERAVDVDASICLDSGMLELIACTKNSKEHEAIFAVEAKAMHIHTALLLLRAKPGNPAMQKQVGGEDGHWVQIPPRGGEVAVYLVFKNSEGKMVEHPINDFISRAADAGADSDDAKTPDAEAIKFPTHKFLFAGSQLIGDGPGPKQYLSDQSGNVISIVTFGDELLCLPDVQAQDNASLIWEVNSENLPPVGTKVILRMRPVLDPAAKTAPVAPTLSKP